jgi:FKBP-type peptidyl-prolyl cis-trans isomerase FklB
MNRLIGITHRLCLLMAVALFVSCGENDDKEEEFPHWQKTNTAYFNNLFATTKSAIESGDTSWKLIKSWSIPEDNENFTSAPEDYIVVKVLETGTGSGCPLYTDNAWVHYQGRLLPSTSYANGYVFDQSFYGTFNENTAVPAKLTVSGTVAGFATALQKMHIGDRWLVYIPYQLGYGEKIANDVIPAFSTLIFDIKLVAYARQGADDRAE